MTICYCLSAPLARLDASGVFDLNAREGFLILHQLSRQFREDTEGFFSGQGRQRVLLPGPRCLVLHEVAALAGSEQERVASYVLLAGAGRVDVTGNKLGTFGAVTQVREALGREVVSERRACRVLGQPGQMLRLLLPQLGEDGRLAHLHHRRPSRGPGALIRFSTDPPDARPRSDTEEYDKSGIETK